MFKKDGFMKSSKLDGPKIFTSESKGLLLRTYEKLSKDNS